jgi:HK97 family phage prohead protease/HK97 family phage major capsid protein
MNKKLLKLDSMFLSKAVNEEGDLIIEGFANTTDKDRAGDVIVQEAWGTKSALPNYLKNPIILAYHDHSHPVGKMISHQVTDKGLHITAKISKAAGQVYDLIKDEVLQAFSVGFRVLDADYDSATDIFVIKDLELHEISVVSVPMNQESTFRISKSFDSDDELETFKADYTKPIMSTKDLETEEFSMDPKELQKTIDAAIAASAAKLAAEAKVKADAEAKEKADTARISVVVKSQTENLVADLEARMKVSAESGAKAIAELQDQIIAKNDEIKSILAARGNKMEFDEHKHAAGSYNMNDMTDAFLLAKVCSKDLFGTKLGTNMAKAVNSSSSGQVSSDKYEQEVTSSLYEDMKKMLTVQPLFREVQLTSATQVLPINPNATSAGWVDPANYGAAATTGPELTKSLTEIILQTFKLAGKSFITDETEEDAIIPILPLLRDQLVEAHSDAIDLAFLSGSGSANNPTGLITRALATGGTSVNTTTAKADGTVKVTAKMLLQTRRGLAQWGLKLNNLKIIVSQDAYWDLLEDTEFQNVNEVGNLATKLTGQVGAVYGIPVMISTQMPAKAVSATYAVLVNTTNFLVPRLRGFTVQSEYSVESQRRLIASTQRLGFNSIIADKGVAVATYAAA